MAHPETKQDYMRGGINAVYRRRYGMATRVGLRLEQSGDIYRDDDREQCSDPILDAFPQNYSRRPRLGDGGGREDTALPRRERGDSSP